MRPLSSRRVPPGALLLLLLWSWLTAAPAPAAGLAPGLSDALIDVTDFAALGREAAALKRPILLEVASHSCPHCRRLERDVLVPTLRGGAYAERVLIRRLTLEAGTVVDFDGAPQRAGALARRYGAQLVPTVLLLGPDGALLAPPVVGYTTPELYWGYVEAAIETAEARLAGG